MSNRPGQGGDYAMALKGNQGTLHDDVRTFLDDLARPAAASVQTVDGDHGRDHPPEHGGDERTVGLGFDPPSWTL